MNNKLAYLTIFTVLIAIGLAFIEVKLFFYVLTIYVIILALVGIIEIYLSLDE